MSGVDGRETTIFVYGTLMQGEPNHHMLSGATRIGVARTATRYTLIDLGPWPVLVLGGSQAVLGELYRVGSELLASLDEFEEVPTLYQRVAITLDDVRSAQAWVQPPDRPPNGAVITSGDWRRRQ